MVVNQSVQHSNYKLNSICLLSTSHRRQSWHYCGFNGEASGHVSGQSCGALHFSEHILSLMESNKTSLTAVSWQTIFSHLHRSQPKSHSSCVSVSTSLPQDQYARGDPGIDCWKRSLVKFGSNFIDYLQVCYSDNHAVLHRNNEKCRELTGRLDWRPETCSVLNMIELNGLNHLNLVEQQLVPQTIVAHDAAAELGLFPPHSVVKQSSLQWRVERTQDLKPDRWNIRYLSDIFQIPLNFKKRPLCSWTTETQYWYKMPPLPLGMIIRWSFIW